MTGNRRITESFGRKGISNMWIEEKIKAVYGRMEKSEKTVFVTSMIVGILAHLYAFTNTIPNFDGVGRMYDEQQMTVSGRWFLHYASRIGSLSSPYLISTLAYPFGPAHGCPSAP